jgi:hypothetical protein
MSSCTQWFLDLDGETDARSVEELMPVKGRDSTGRVLWCALPLLQGESRTSDLCFIGAVEVTGHGQLESY